MLGGGFGGVCTALQLERRVARGAPLDVSLVNRENYLVFQPKLAEVIAGDVATLTGSARCGTCLSARAVSCGRSSTWIYGW